MIRNCDVCSRPYEAKLVTSRFCSGTCRVRNARAPRPRPEVPTAVDYALRDATRAELEAAGRINTWQGQVLLLLAEKICESGTGSGTAALSQEFRRVRAAALQGVPAGAPDPVDEVKARRDRKKSSNFHKRQPNATQPS